MTSARRRCHLKVVFFYLFLALAAIFFSRGTILAILVKRHKRNTSVKLFWNPETVCGGDVFKAFSIFSSGHHFVQPSGTILAILEESPWRKTSVQIFWNWAIGQGRDVVEILVLALVAILFNGAEPLGSSWISDRHNFSSFQSRSHPVATEQVSAQSNQRFGKRCWKFIFKMAASLFYQLI